jgi:hypothetical protein
VTTFGADVRIDAAIRFPAADFFSGALKIETASGTVYHHCRCPSFAGKTDGAASFFIQAANCAFVITPANDMLAVGIIAGMSIPANIDIMPTNFLAGTNCRTLALTAVDYAHSHLLL